jgi:hypothetical protein
VAFAPAWIVRHDIGVHGGSQLSAADRLKAVNDVRVVLLQGAAGLVALGGTGLGAVLTLRQIRVSREGQFIDLFARAIEQLSSEQVSVRARRRVCHGADRRCGTALPRPHGRAAGKPAGAHFTGFARIEERQPWPAKALRLVGPSARCGRPGPAA